MGVKVDFIGGVDEAYMVSNNAGVELQVVFLTLEDVKDMMWQFKDLLKYEQWREII
jgi:hypothetical protein